MRRRRGGKWRRGGGRRRWRRGGGEGPLTHEKVGHLQLLLICCQTPSDLRVSLLAAEKDHIKKENVPATHQPLKPNIWLYRGPVWFQRLCNAHLSHSLSLMATPP